MALTNKKLNSLPHGHTPRDTLRTYKSKSTPIRIGNPGFKLGAKNIRQSRHKTRSVTPNENDDIQILDDYKASLEKGKEKENNRSISIDTDDDEVSHEDNKSVNRSTIIPDPSTSIDLTGSKEDSDIIIPKSKVPKDSKTKNIPVPYKKDSNSSKSSPVYDLKKATFKSSDHNNMIPLSDETLFVIFKTSKMIISNDTQAFLINIPYNRIKMFKRQRRTSSLISNNTNVLLNLSSDLNIKIKDYSYTIENVVLEFTNSFNSIQIKRIKECIGDDCIYDYMNSNEIRLYCTPFAFQTSSSEMFYGSGNTEMHTSAMTNSSMKTDFSSLNKSERKSKRNRRCGSLIKYKNEDSEDEKANEKMISENGDTVISDYIPEDDQFILDPPLKYKLDNKKTITITNNDFKCLYNGNWINDTLVDFFLNYHLKTAREKNIPKANNIEIFNSFFFTSLARPIENDDYYKNVKSWFKMNNTLFDKDYVVIPIMQDLHWYLVVITNLKSLKRKHTKLKRASEAIKNKIEKSEITDSQNHKEVTLDEKVKEKDIPVPPKVGAGEAIETMTVKEFENLPKNISSSQRSENSADIQVPDSDIDTQATDKEKDDAFETADESLGDSKILTQNDLQTPATNKSTLIFDKSNVSTDDDSQSIDKTIDDGSLLNVSTSPTVPKIRPAKPTDEKMTGIVQICILDSLTRNHEKAIVYLKNFIVGYAAEKYGFNVKTNEIIKHKCVIPQQNNFNDCGLHLVLNVETMLQDPVAFDKQILRRSPKGHKQTIRMRKENGLFFNQKKMLNIRKDLREFLFNLLREQITNSGGDASKIGLITARQKRLQDLQERKSGVNGTTTQKDGLSGAGSDVNGGTNSEGNVGDNNEEEKDDDDDLMIIHAEDKHPVVKEDQLSVTTVSSVEYKGTDRNNVKVKRKVGRPRLNFDHLRRRNKSQKSLIVTLNTKPSEDNNSNKKLPEDSKRVTRATTLSKEVVVTNAKTIQKVQNISQSDDSSDDSDSQALSLLPETPPRIKPHYYVERALIKHKKHYNNKKSKNKEVKLDSDSDSDSYSDVEPKVNSLKNTYHGKRTFKKSFQSKPVNFESKSKAICEDGKVNRENSATINNNPLSQDSHHRDSSYINLSDSETENINPDEIGTDTKILSAQIDKELNSNSQPLAINSPIPSQSESQSMDLINQMDDELKSSQEAAPHNFADVKRETEEQLATDNTDYKNNVSQIKTDEPNKNVYKRLGDMYDEVRQRDHGNKYSLEPPVLSLTAIINDNMNYAEEQRKIADEKRIKPHSAARNKDSIDQKTNKSLIGDLVPKSPEAKVDLPKSNISTYHKISNAIPLDNESTNPKSLEMSPLRNVSSPSNEVSPIKITDNNSPVKAAHSSVAVVTELQSSMKENNPPVKGSVSKYFNKPLFGKAPEKKEHMEHKADEGEKSNSVRDDVQEQCLKMQRKVVTDLKLNQPSKFLDNSLSFKAHAISPGTLVSISKNLFKGKPKSKNSSTNQLLLEKSDIKTLETKTTDLKIPNVEVVKVVTKELAIDEPNDNIISSGKFGQSKIIKSDPSGTSISAISKPSEVKPPEIKSSEIKPGETLDNVKDDQVNNVSKSLQSVNLLPVALIKEGNVSVEKAQVKKSKVGDVNNGENEYSEGNNGNVKRQSKSETKKHDVHDKEDNGEIHIDENLKQNSLSNIPDIKAPKTEIEVKELTSIDRRVTRSGKGSDIEPIVIASPQKAPATIESIQLVESDDNIDSSQRKRKIGKNKRGRKKRSNDSSEQSSTKRRNKTTSVSSSTPSSDESFKGYRTGKPKKRRDPAQELMTWDSNLNNQNIDRQSNSRMTRSSKFRNERESSAGEFLILKPEDKKTSKVKNNYEKKVKVDEGIFDSKISFKEGIGSRVASRNRSKKSASPGTNSDSSVVITKPNKTGSRNKNKQTYHGDVEDTFKFDSIGSNYYDSNNDMAISLTDAGDDDVHFKADDSESHMF